MPLVEPIEPTGLPAYRGSKSSHMTDEFNPARKGRAVSDEALKQFEKNFFAGTAGDYEMTRLLESARIQRTVLRKLFNYFKPAILRRVSSSDPIVNSELAYLKELVAMETP